MEELGIIEPESTGRVQPDAAPNSPASAHSLEQAAHAFRDLLHLHDGDNLDSWCESYRGNHEHARLFRDLHRSSPEAAARLVEGLAGLPEIGDTFLGFRLEQELGRGAFGRVYLARQP